MVDIIISWMGYLGIDYREWRDMGLFKEDIKSCFQQLNMTPDASLYLVMCVTEGDFLVNFCGTFGFTGSQVGSK